MPIREICSPNSSGQKPKPQRPPAPPGVQHAAVYGDAARRSDQSNQPLPIPPSSSARS